MNHITNESNPMKQPPVTKRTAESAVVGQVTVKTNTESESAESNAINSIFRIPSITTIDIPQEGVIFEPENKDEASYYALASGIFGLPSEKAEHVLKTINLDLFTPMIKSSLSKRLAMLLNKVFANGLIHFHNEHKTAIMTKAMNLKSQTPIEEKEMEQILAFSTEFKGVMPKRLLTSLGKMLNLEVEDDQSQTADIKIGLKDGYHICEIPAEKINENDFHSPINLKAFDENRLEQDNILSDCIENDGEINMNAIRVLFQNMSYQPMGKNNVMPILGMTQTGKTSLFNFLIGQDNDDSELSSRVGRGINSETALYLQKEAFETLITDTPGLVDSRGNLFQTIIDYQLVELLRSNNVSKIIVTLKRSDFFSQNMASNGITNLKNFFHTHFDVRKINDGFYHRIFNEHFSTDFLGELKSLFERNVSGSAKTVINKKWSPFLKALETEIDKLTETPFFVVVRNDDDSSEYTQDMLNNQINTNLVKIHDEIIYLVHKEKGAINPQIDQTILYFLYLLLIKKDIHVADLKNKHLKDLVKEKRFNFESIKNPLEDITGVTQFRDILVNIMIKFEALLKPYDAAISTIPEKLNGLNQLKDSIARLQKFIDSDALPNESQSEIKAIEFQIEAIKEDIIEISNKLKNSTEDKNMHDTDDPINRTGWPKTRTAQPAILWKYIEVGHEKEDKQIIVRQTEKFNKIKYYDSSVLIRFDYWWKEKKEQDYKATVDNLTTKKLFYRAKIAALKKDIELLNEKLNEKNSALEIQNQNLITNKAETHEKLLDEYMKLKIQLEKEQADVHTYLKEKSKLFSEFESSRSDLKLLYHFFSDERFKFFSTLIFR